MPFVFGADENVVLGTKTGQLGFSKSRQQQLINSGNKISIPKIF